MKKRFSQSIAFLIVTGLSLQGQAIDFFPAHSSHQISPSVFVKQALAVRSCVVPRPQGINAALSAELFASLGHTEEQPPRREFLGLIAGALGAASGGLTFTLVSRAQTRPAPPNAEDQRLINAALLAAVTALNHLEQDGYAKDSPVRADVMGYLRYLRSSKDFRVIPDLPLAAQAEDPPSRTIKLGRQMFASSVAEERPGILAHEAAHQTLRQRARTLIFIAWDEVWKKVGAAGVKKSKALQKDFKRALAMLVRNEWEAIQFELAYRASEARAQGYTDIRQYYLGLASVSRHPATVNRYRSFANAFTSWDLSPKAARPVAFDEDAFLRGLLFRQFLPAYDTELLYDMAKSEGFAVDRNAANQTVMYDWALSWLKKPEFYNPPRPSSSPKKKAGLGVFLGQQA